MAISLTKINAYASNHLTDYECELIKHAFDFAKNVYSDKKTPLGIRYTENYLNTAVELLELNPDAITLCACFLQKVPSFDSQAATQIEVKFGKEIAQMVLNLNEINNISEKKDTALLMSSKEINQTMTVDVLRRMFLAMAKDLRVILVQLAEKLSTLVHAKHLENGLRKTCAQDALEIFVPIADRLGIFQFKRQIEDLCFKELNPDEYDEIQTQFTSGGKTLNKTLEVMKKSIHDFLGEHNISAQIEGRIKGYYSTFKKMKKKNFSNIDKVLDLFAIRIILPDSEDCYRVLGLLHNKWQPLHGRFKDYIAAPKVNGYRSIHTIIIGLAKEIYNKPVELQIRTESMHSEAQFGIAAHWWYKEAPVEKRVAKSLVKSHQEKIKNNFEEKIQWVRNLVDLHENLKNNNDEFKDAVKLNLFSDRIFVLTPQGDVKDLPKGATPIDFAYEVHSNLGNHCAHAKVNGENVPLDHELGNGDTVEIVSDHKKSPNRYWLSFVKTSKARERIRSWIKSLGSDDLMREGKKLLNKHLQNLNKPLLDSENMILRDFGGSRLTVRERDELLEEIGKGTLSPMAVLKKLFPDDQIFKKRTESLKWKEVDQKKLRQPRILVTGETGYETKLNQCCNPQPGDPIIGYTTRGGVVSIHKPSCRLLGGLNKKRIIKVTWEGHEQRGATTRIKVRILNKNNALFFITKVIRESEIEIVDFNKHLEGQSVILTFDLEVFDYEQLDLLINKLEQLEAVEKIETNLGVTK